MKKALKASCLSGVPLEQALAVFLLRYRSTPHSTTGVSPSTLFFGRELRTRLDLLVPDVGTRVRDKQASQKTYHDRRAKARSFQIGQSVWARNYRDGPDWVPATIVDQLGPLSYLVRLQQGELWRRHIDHLRSGADQSLPPVSTEPASSTQTDDFLPYSTGSDQQSGAATDTSPTTPTTTETVPNTTDRPSTTSHESTPSNMHRYPKRNRKPPDRYS